MESEDKHETGTIIPSATRSLAVRSSALVSRGLRDLEENAGRTYLADKRSYPYCEEFVNERIHGWCFWVLNTPLYRKFRTQKNSKHQSDSQESFTPTPATPAWGLEGWSPGKAAEAACSSCGNLPGLTCTCGLHAFREKCFAWPSSPDIAGAVQSPCVFGEVIGWGHTIIREREWKAARAYPLSLILICGYCACQKRQYKPASLVLVANHL